MYSYLLLPAYVTREPISGSNEAIDESRLRESFFNFISNNTIISIPVWNAIFSWVVNN
jgi:hypothetical protein